MFMLFPIIFFFHQYAVKIDIFIYISVSQATKAIISKFTEHKQSSICMFVFYNTF